MTLSIIIFSLPGPLKQQATGISCISRKKGKPLLLRRFTERRSPACSGHGHHPEQWWLWTETKL